MSQRLAASVERAVDAFKSGGPVLIHDAADREGETDLIYPAAAVTPKAVARLRNDAGGLVCLALSHRVSAALDLPFVADAVDHPAAGGPVAYDERSSFSLSVNHVRTYTGVTDRDRAKTITALAAAADAAATGDYDVDDFAEEFRAPGHVHLLRGAPSLDERQGHTELALALAATADVEPATVVCEMLDDATGSERSKWAARDYADRHDLPFVEGRTIVETLG